MMSLLMSLSMTSWSGIDDIGGATCVREAIHENETQHGHEAIHENKTDDVTSDDVIDDVTSDNVIDDITSNSVMVQGAGIDDVMVQALMM